MSGAVVRVSVPMFVSALWRRSRAGMLRCVLLLTLATITEGVGLLLLVPMLALAGVPLGSGAMDGIARWIGTVLGQVGLPATLPVMLVAAVIVIGARAALTQAVAVASTRFAVGIVSAERLRLFRAVTAMRWERFVRLRGADVVQALTIHAESASQATRAVLRLLAEGAAIAVSLVIAFRISWLVTLLVCLAGVVLLAWLSILRAPGREEGERLVARDEALFRATTDAIAGMKVIKGYAAEWRTVEAYGGADRAVVDAVLRLDAMRARSGLAVGVGTAVLLSALLYVALAVLQLAPAAVLLLLAMYTRLVPRLSSAQTNWHHLNESLATWDSVQTLTASCERDAAPSARAHAPVPRPVHAPAVTVENVSFCYDGAARDVLRHSTFSIPAGGLTAIVGPSGAGKSTATDLLIGLLRPNTGRVLVDGRQLLDDHVDAWRAHLGLLPQDVALFPGTIRDNLRWACPDASDESMRVALAAAAAQFIDALPHGLDTVVGDRGSLLSGGERQRLALARALLRDPSLLVLDEATSALDAEHETAILQSLRALLPRVTIVIISHRLSVARAADHVVVLDDGVVLAEGTWESVSATDERVRTLLAL